MTEREIANKYFENVAKIQYGATTAANESYVFSKVIFVKLHWSTQKKSSLLKYRVIIVVLTLLNPNMTIKLPCHPLMLRERGLNYKITFVIEWKHIGF
jgi:hypothetical protein